MDPTVGSFPDGTVSSAGGVPRAGPGPRESPSGSHQTLTNEWTPGTLLGQTPSLGT